MAPTIPSIEQLSKAEPAEVERVLGLLFEPSPTLVAIVGPGIREATPASYPALVEAVRATLHAMRHAGEAKRESLYSILGAHPRLGARRVDSAMSRAEQESLQGENDQLLVLNEKYESQFPGLIYVIWVNGRPRSEIIADIKRRITQSTQADEEATAVDAMCDIALDRYRKLSA